MILTLGQSMPCHHGCNANTTEKQKVQANKLSLVLKNVQYQIGFLAFKKNCEFICYVGFTYVYKSDLCISDDVYRRKESDWQGS